MMAQNNYWIDANIILRYITNDHEELSPIARKVIERFAKLEVNGFINTLVLHEVIYVLENVYFAKRKIIVEHISNFISITGIQIIDLEKNLVKLALLDYQKVKVDFPDCVYKQISSGFDYDILSFDKDFRKIGVDAKVA